MLIRDRFDGSGSPFEGDREIVLRRLPADARVVSARAVLTPGDGSIEIDFTTDDCTWGATRIRRQRWVEIDFHSRRTLAEVAGSNLLNTSLQVDLGSAVFTDVNSRGALGGSRGDLFTLGSATQNPLPGLTVSRFKLTARESDGANDPTVSRIDVRSVPTNVSLSLGGQSPFWTRPGDLSVAVTTSDFGQVLQAFLAEATIKNGFYALPLVVHSDSIAHLEIALEIEILCAASVLPEGLAEVAMSFDHGSLSRETTGLQVALPPNARVTATSGRATGAFAPSRVVFGQTGKVDARKTAKVGDGISQAQLVALPAKTATDAVDLLLVASSRTARLQVDLLENLDGKPGGTSFLAKPVSLDLDREQAGGQTWVSVDLPAEMQLEAEKERRYWLVVQSLDGEAAWAAKPAAGGPALQQTRDGGLSWRQTGPEPLVAWFRLRRRTKRFHMPLRFEVGTGKDAESVSLERFEAVGRVDLRLGFPEVAERFNRYLAAVAPVPCPETEHLVNGEFTDWPGLADDVAFDLSTGTTVPTGETVPLQPAEWALTSGVAQPIAFSPVRGAALGPVEFDPGTPAAISQVVPVAAGCIYEFSFAASATDEGAVAEVHWLGSDCALLRRDSLPIEEIDPLLHRARIEAPADATQAEVRFLVPEGILTLERASLRGTASSVSNGDLRVLAAGVPVAWAQVPEPDQDFTGSPTLDQMSLQQGLLHNSGSESLSLVQTVPVVQERPFTFEFQGREKVRRAASAETRLRWLREDDSPTGEEVPLEIVADGFESLAAAGTPPKDAARAELALTIPPGSKIEVQKVDLRFEERVSVPLRPISESPGELRIEDLEVAWEPLKVPPPSLPDQGLCTPTPPGFEPGELRDCDCFCGHCGCAKKMKNSEPAITPGGRALRVGECSGCGAPLIRFGGRPVAGVKLPTVVRGISPQVPIDTPPSPLTTIRGIGERRAGQLQAARISTLDELSRADPVRLQRLLSSVTLAGAKRFVSEAERLLRDSSES